MKELFTMQKLILCFFLGLLVAMPASSPRRYSYYRTATATSSKITVRQASSGTRPLTFMGGWQKVSTACAMSITSGGTVSGGSSVSASSVPLLDNRSPVSTAAITLDGTVSGDATRISEASQTRQDYEGGMSFGAGSTPAQFTMQVTGCGGSYTIEQYLQYHEE